MAGTMYTFHEGCWRGHRGRVESSRGSPGTMTPRMTRPGRQKGVAGDGLLVVAASKV